MKSLFTLLIFSLFTLPVFANVHITEASGGTLLDRSTSTSNGDPGGYALLGNVIISENADNDFLTSGTFILNAPQFWQFNPSSNIVPIVTSTTGQPKVAIEVIQKAANGITFLITVENTNKRETVTISGIEIQCIDENLTSESFIYSTGSATILGVLNNSTSFGPVSLDPSSPFPVELTSFSANVFGRGVELKWLTATEVNNYGFEVQRSRDDDNWITLGFVEGYGNSNSPKSYNYYDNELVTGGNYLYRLKQIDNDGSFKYSKSLEINFNLPTALELKQNYPNPFNPSTTISFTLPESGNISLKIFGSLGEEKATLVNGYVEEGIHIFNFNAEDYPSGIYVYRLTAGQNVLTKKMLLLK
ncbi:T9SS type A sorting domain-containing protein [bacterium BMS3Abin03]|nr:T9SS type A sorting domain-containing protein [bacterium BMS3Abin03]